MKEQITKDEYFKIAEESGGFSVQEGLSVFGCHTFLVGDDGREEDDIYTEWGHAEKDTPLIACQISGKIPNRKYEYYKFLTN